MALGIGGAVGYFYAPDKIKTVEKIVEKTIKEKDTKNTKRYDPITGKLIEEIAETKDKETNIESTSKTTEKSKSQKQWAVKGGVALNPKDLSGKLVPRIGFETALPIFQASAGIEADINIDNPFDLDTYTKTASYKKQGLYTSRRTGRMHSVINASASFDFSATF